jgi:hypothetical protein
LNNFLNENSQEIILTQPRNPKSIKKQDMQFNTINKPIPTTDRLSGSRALPPNKISKKHIRANSSINNYPASNQLQHHHPMQPQITQPTMGGLGNIISAQKKSILSGLNPNKIGTRDSLNITNSLIISNSQILF